MGAIVRVIQNQAHHCHQEKEKGISGANRHKTSVNAVVRTVMFVGRPILHRDATTATHTASSALLRQMMTGERDKHHKTDVINVNK
jgi:hypothetical protein